jgi:hypothetical protein
MLVKIQVYRVLAFSNRVFLHTLCASMRLAGTSVGEGVSYALPPIVKGKGGEDNFSQWFVGFADAESNFSIHSVSDSSKIKISKFSFMFNIELHKDDVNVLKYIKAILGVGNIRIYNDKCVFTVSNKEGILKLIKLFDKYNLNTTKYLDYIDFKEAFLLYHNREGKLTKELTEQILKLKDSMNSKRSNFTMPSTHVIAITKS